MRKAIGIFLCALTAMTVALSCTQPYDMTSVLGGKTLTYSWGPEGTETYVFAKNGKSGTYSRAYFDYQYPDATSEGDYTKKEWVQTSGQRGTFTYNPDTHERILSATHRYARTPGATTYYRADYKEYEILAYAKLNNPDTSAVAWTETRNVLFNQDVCESIYTVGVANEWTHTNTFSQVKTVGSDIYTYTDLWTERYTIAADAIKYIGSSDRSNLENSVKTNEEHDTSEKSYTVYAIYEVGDTKEGQTFAELWKKDKIVTFIENQTNETYKEWEGATAPTAPTVDLSTGIGEAGTLNDDPLNYYKIDNNTYQTSMTFQHYGTFMTWFSSSANRNFE